jgi:lipopolysaccharide export system protein LptC
MKRLLSRQGNLIIKKHCLSGWNILRSGIFLLTGFLCFASCENEIEKIKSLSGNNTLPEVSGKNFEIIYSDSGKVKVRILAPEINKYSQAEQPYIEFPRGMKAYFYDDSLKIESVIEAGYVKYYDAEKLWEAKNNVEARNLKKGEQLNTEHLFWNQEKKTIYSNTSSRIVTEQGTFYGEKGFESNQDLTKWKLKSSKGTVNVKNE